MHIHVTPTSLCVCELCKHDRKYALKTDNAYCYTERFSWRVRHPLLLPIEKKCI